MTGAREIILHASCVAMEGRGLLIMGAAGSGKSATALQLMAMGAALVSDDVTRIRQSEGALMASCPATIAGLIEARGLGILRAPALPEARLVLAVDMDREETERLPPHRSIPVLGQDLDLVLRPGSCHFPAALRCYLLFGRHG